MYFKHQTFHSTKMKYSTCIKYHILKKRIYKNIIYKYTYMYINKELLNYIYIYMYHNDI